MRQKLHIDIETFSSVDITTSGSYKYFESPDFEILMIAYAFEDAEVQISEDTSPNSGFMKNLRVYLLDPKVEKIAHNANFERNAFKAYGIDTPIEQWTCSAVKAGYCGLPLSLDGVSKALDMGDKGKSAAGKALIKYFSCPVKATKVNGRRTRNLPHHNPEKWEEFKQYCIQDVEAERNICRILDKYEFPASEVKNYILDQEINDRGILIDTAMAQSAYEIDELFSAELFEELRQATRLDNPNSPVQLKKWLSTQLDTEVKSVAKESILSLLAGKSNALVDQVLNLRQMGSKTSTKKYVSMLNCFCKDQRAHGLFQFYGANRTGRWAGRLIQMQNLPQNKIKDLDLARSVIASGDYGLVKMIFDNVPSILSQLIRTAFIAKPQHTFAVADFSAIEARVIAWLSGEAWRLKVFNSHGKIYEASASKMFNIPIEQVTKGSHWRDKGKVAELALGYQGAVGALKTMGGEKMGLSEIEMDTIVKKWRKANPAIVQMWYDFEGCALRAVKLQKKVVSQYKGIVFDCDGKVLTIQLPSGRKLFYQSPSLSVNKWGKECLLYKGMDQMTKQWTNVDTYGGKLTENIVQAIARDLLADAMQRVNTAGFDIVMHVHDELVCEIKDFSTDLKLKTICAIMGDSDPIYKGVPFPAEGYLTPYYKKD